MFCLTDSINLSGYNVIIPSIGVGNVAQLAVDLIISTLKMKRIGSGYHNACMPIMGPSAYEHDNTKTTSLEVFADTNVKLLVFQLRSPLVSVYIDSFHKDLLEFIKNKKLGTVFILTSSHAYEKHDVNSPIFAYLQNSEFKTQNKTELNLFGWQEYNGKVIFGGGNGKKLFDECSNLNIPTFLLFNYISEGDNSMEASQLVSEINRIIKLFDKESNIKLLIPISWQYLFGNSVPELIF